MQSRVLSVLAVLAGLSLLGCQKPAPAEPSSESVVLQAQVRDLEARFAALEQASGKLAETDELGSPTTKLERALRELREELRTQRTLLEPLQHELATLRARQAAPASYRAVNLAVGELPPGGSQPEQRPIPETVPAAAREILVYARVATGYVKGGPHRFRMATRLKNGEEAAFYLYALGQSQPGWAYNSDNFWLPMPEDRMLIVETEGDPFFGDWNSEVRIVGYR